MCVYSVQFASRTPTRHDGTKQFSRVESGNVDWVFEITTTVRSSNCCTGGSGTFRTPLYPGLRRFVALCGRVRDGHQSEHFAASFKCARKFDIFARSLSIHLLLNFCSTATRLQYRPRPSSPRLRHHRYANRPCGHRRRCTKRRLVAYRVRSRRRRRCIRRGGTTIVCRRPLGRGR